MRTRIIALAAALLAAGAVQAESEIELEPANNNIANTASLQRGAKYFVNYCMGCHSAKYVRYNRLGEDLQLTEDQLVNNVMFTGEQPFDTMSIAMRPEDAARWFGIAPPDLSLIARSRGADYIYSYLRSFYVDPSRPTGVDNLVLPGTAMPDVLWQLQGLQKPVFAGGSEGGGEGGGEGEGDGAGGEGEFEHFEIVRPGLLSESEYDQVVRDIVNFLDYVGEPMKRARQALGIRVIAFLLVFLLIAYMLKKEIWKDVT